MSGFGAIVEGRKSNLEEQYAEIREINHIEVDAFGKKHEGMEGRWCGYHLVEVGNLPVGKAISGELARMRIIVPTEKASPELRAAAAKVNSKVAMTLDRANVLSIDELLASKKKLENKQRVENGPAFFPGA